MPSNSVNNSEPEDLFRLIAEGGQNFTARVTAYTKAKEEHDKAWAALQLGRLTKNTLLEAEAAKAAAEKLLTEARSKADAILAEAMQKADAVLQHGNDRHKAVLIESAVLEKKNAELTAGATARAYKVQDEANAKLAEANRLGAENTRKARELATAAGAAQRATAEAEALKAELTRKHKETVDFHKRQWG